jgi:hypothetical protein
LIEPLFFPFFENVRKVAPDGQMHLVRVTGIFFYQRFDSTRLSASPSRTDLSIYVPYALVFAACIIQPSAFLLRRRKRYLPGLCQKCGYDLRASTGKCPECGALNPNRNVLERKQRDAKARNGLELRWFGVTLGLKVLVISLWMFILIPFHLDGPWPSILTFLTSAPSFYRFVEGPTASLSSLFIYLDCVLINSMVWAYLIARFRTQGRAIAREIKGDTGNADL